MNANHTLERDNARLIDALVDGELAETQRCDLLRRLEQSPGGWRQLSLAFLEAQSWRQALKTECSISLTPPVRAARRTPRRAAAWTAAWAVSALVAFVLGFSANGTSRPESPERSATATNAVAPSLARESGASNSTVQSAAMARTLSPAARQQLERLGFRIHERPRVVSVQQPDGQTVQVLVHEVELHFVGRQYSL